MRTSRDLKSPWGQRVWYDEPEFDSMMDESVERAGIGYDLGRGVDVEEVLLKGYGLSPDFCELEAGVLGRTLFHSTGRIEVQISEELALGESTSATTRRRLRSTLAHELAHVVLHRHLHSFGMEPLFAELKNDEPKVLCRATVISEPQRMAQDWWEYQANRGMSCLLLPKLRVRQAVDDCLLDLGARGVKELLARGSGDRLVDSIVGTFDVSFEMALYRLQDLGYVPRDVRQTQLSTGE